MSRLIDAERFEHIGFQTKCEKRYDDGFSDGVMFVAQKIDAAPTIDAIPVEWILNKVGDEETYTLKFRHAWSTLVSLWQKEQEAQNG